ncbi:MAG: hypothetical protein Ct9H300mP21_08370 [Pseudomonadota bacterium]|nr:MAG: hypothetical protein Ct9H300mP21_08370 [Pseudomonadota bacterium]
MNGYFSSKTSTDIPNNNLQLFGLKLKKLHLKVNEVVSRFDALSAESVSLCFGKPHKADPWVQADFPPRGC